VKPVYQRSMEQLIMRRCSTVEEAVNLMNQYDPRFTSCRQYLLVDRTGAAAVFEYGAVVWMDGESLALTNFHLSNPSDGHHPCWRYTAVMRELAENTEASVSRVAEIVDAAQHVSTMYSIVCDLTACEAFVYCVGYTGDYETPRLVDLETLWRDGADYTVLAALPRAEL